MKPVEPQPTKAAVEPAEKPEKKLSLVKAAIAVLSEDNAALTVKQIIAAAKDYDPARITRYVLTLATLFHKFYNACRVRGEEEDLMYARLYLSVAAKTVIKNVLTLLKIDAPESM